MPAARSGHRPAGILAQQLIAAPASVRIAAHAEAERPAGAARGEKAQVLEPGAGSGPAPVHPQQQRLLREPAEEPEFGARPCLAGNGAIRVPGSEAAGENPLRLGKRQVNRIETPEEA